MGIVSRQGVRSSWRAGLGAAILAYLSATLFLVGLAYGGWCGSPMRECAALFPTFFGLASIVGLAVGIVVAAGIRILNLPVARLSAVKSAAIIAGAAVLGLALGIILLRGQRP